MPAATGIAPKALGTVDHFRGRVDHHENPTEDRMVPSLAVARARL
jgi:hypothetical protein